MDVTTAARDAAHDGYPNLLHSDGVFFFFLYGDEPDTFLRREEQAACPRIRRAWDCLVGLEFRRPPVWS